MLEAQHIMGGGVMQVAVEHVGDLTHRMTHMLSWGNGPSEAGINEVGDKVKKVLRMIRSPYGFMREFHENVTNNARYQGKDPKQHWQQVEAALRRYAQAHAELPVFNRAQWYARDAAIRLGLLDVERMRASLGMLERLLSSPTAYNYQTRLYLPDKDGLPTEIAPAR